MVRLLILLVMLNAAFFLRKFNVNEPAVQNQAVAVPVADNIPMLVMLSEVDGLKPQSSKGGGGLAPAQDGTVE